MTCYHPIIGYRSYDLNPSGKRSLTFNPAKGIREFPVTIACGQCIGCRLSKSRDWAIRCIHESQYHDENSFITLTYDNAHLKSSSLNKRDIQLWLKKIRKKLQTENIKIRYLQCGEYGDLYQRPHHHVLLFGYAFPDRKLFTVHNGNPIYISKLLSETWVHGYSSVSDMTYDTCAYVARYVTKKITGDLADEHYKGRLPEYITMSRRPGIGKAWYDRHGENIRRTDEVKIIEKNLTLKPPKYYDYLYDIQDPVGYAAVKAERKDQQRYAERRLRKEYPDLHDYRTAKELNHKDKAKKLNRPLESGQKWKFL